MAKKTTMIQIILYVIVLYILFFMSGCGSAYPVNESQSTQPDKDILSESPANPVQSSQTSKTQETVSNLFGDTKNDQLENPEYYTDNVFKWSIEYPSDWNISTPNSATDTLTPDGDPERGVFISIGNEAFFDSEDMLYHNQLYIYHFVSHINFYQTVIPYNELEKEEFSTSNNINGIIMFARKNSNVYIYLSLGEGAFYGARMIVSEDVFDKYHKQIYSILRSINVEDPQLLLNFFSKIREYRKYELLGF